jgi:uracil-DNA glycosylase family 4
VPPLNPELQAAVAAQLEYYRDLGIYDFYRRAVHNAVAASHIETDTSPAIEIEEINEPVLSPTNLEEIPIAARKTSPLLPLANPTQDYMHIQGKGASALLQIREEIGDCTRCKLSVGRNKIVFGDGDPKARLMFVGEGPGADEDASGLPFVGRGGQLLNNMINAMGLKREQVYIANIVKCRPPSNRVPEPDEAHTCIPFLEQQIAAVSPEVIVALGSTAATYLLGVKSALGALRGRIHASRGAKLIVTYHPAFLLRDPRQKKEAWADLKIAMAELGLRAPASQAPSA